MTAKGEAAVLRRIERAAASVARALTSPNLYDRNPFDAKSPLKAALMLLEAAASRQKLAMTPLCEKR